VRKPQAGCVQRDRRAEPGIRRERQPASVGAIADDRTAVSGELGPQLMTTARGGLEFDE
jgi:hypothetical protein